MVSGHLTIKNDQYYCVINYYDENGKRKQAWRATGIPKRGGKKKAEEALNELRRTFEPPKPREPVSDDSINLTSDMPFCDFLRVWLKVVESTVAPTTFSTYCRIVNSHFIPYFTPKNLTLEGVQARHLQEYYLKRLKSVKAMTVKHEHALIHKALKYAFCMDLLPNNPADKISPPKAERFEVEPYTVKEAQELIEKTQNHRLGLLILVTVLYGLRRSEALGIRWKAIDFDNDQLHINHTITDVTVDGKHEIRRSDSTKTKSSCRTLPLLPTVKERLLALREVQKENRRLCGNCYVTEWEEYVFVDDIGMLIKPNYVEFAFPKLLSDLGMRKIRFHDLRHTCATIMNLSHVPMKDVQEYLGHSNIQTTSNLYVHLDWSSKEASAQAMERSMDIPAFEGIKSGFSSGG